MATSAWPCATHPSCFRAQPALGSTAHSNSINCWQDFDDTFVRNFTGTYERPGRPRNLALCVQGKVEPLKDYLARWIKLRNTCEGVHEIQAIQYFIDGCLDGSMLKHKLLRKEVQTLAQPLLYPTPRCAQSV